MNRCLLIVFGFAAGIALLPLACNLVLSQALRPEQIARELTVEELGTSLKHLNPNIKVLAGFEASSYGGFHGDGGDVCIYLIEPSGAEVLLEGLKHFHEDRRQQWPNANDYEWTTASYPNLSSVEHLIPKRFLPKQGDYIIGYTKGGTSTISIGKTNGYVVFATSRS